MLRCWQLFLQILAFNNLFKASDPNIGYGRYDMINISDNRYIQFQYEKLIADTGTDT